MSDTTLPRPIEPGENKKGQLLRLTVIKDGVTSTFERTATANRDGDHVPVFGGSRIWVDPFATWTRLADAPTPAPAPVVGSRWRDPVTGAEYVYETGSRYYCYSDLRAGLDIGRDDAIIARLTPIPDHGDGCSPWLWDEETGTAWVAGSVRDSVTHLQVFGEPTRFGYLSRQYNCDTDVAARLRPWSERGQANG